MGADIEFAKLSVYDVAALKERSDLVLFMGVLYHLRHPLLALDLIREHVAGDLLVFQSMLRGTQEVEAVEPDYPFSAAEHFERPAYPRMAFVENKYCGDETNWWIPNRACAEAMLRSAGFQVIDHPEEEVFVCRVAGRSRWAVSVRWAVARGIRGQGMIEAVMLWNEPDNKSHWDFPIDPEWTRFAAIEPHHTSPPKAPEDFAMFCAEMVRRYAPAAGLRPEGARWC